MFQAKAPNISGFQLLECLSFPCWMPSGSRLVSRTLKTFDLKVLSREFGNCGMHFSPFVDILFTRRLFQIIIKRSIDNKLHFVAPLPHWFVLTIGRGLQAEQWGWMESGWITTWSRFLSHCFRSTPLSNPHRQCILWSFHAARQRESSLILHRDNFSFPFTERWDGSFGRSCWSKNNCTHSSVTSPGKRCQQ